VRRCRGVRMRRLLVLLILFMLLAPAVQAETTSYYALNFDGEDDYVSIPISVTGDFTYIILAKFNCESSDDWWLVDAGSYEFRIYSNPPYSWGNINIGNGTDRVIYGKVFQNYFSKSAQLYAVSVEGSTVKAYVNTDNIFTATDLSVTPSIDTIDIPERGAKNVYLVLIYSRALSDPEIQQIYDDPTNPPTDGLVLWFAPDSVDTANDKWTDKSGNNNDGTIYGASYVPLRPVSEALSDEARALNYVTGTRKGTIIQNVSLGNEGTILLVGRVNDATKGNLIDTRTDWFGSGGTGVTIRDLDSDGGYDFIIANGTVVTYITSKVNLLDNRVHVFGMIWTSTSASAIVDTNIYTKAVSLSEFATGTIYVGSGWEGGTNSTIYLVLLYNRALSDSEIQAIYENPSNPPTDGLVLWYDPYSYEPTNDKWLNRAPIFPTIPLVEELDGTNYGAMAERVSIPRLYVYDANTSEQISYMNVSLTLYFNNTATGLIPSLPILPWNETVTLNISAINYESRTISTWTGVDLISVYLERIPAENENTTINNWTRPDMAIEDATGWSGAEIGKEALSLNFDKALTMFFTQNPDPRVQTIVPFVIFISITIAALVFSQVPVVALGLGAVTQASLASMGAKIDVTLMPATVVLYLFLFIWTLKDFIETFRRD